MKLQKTNTGQYIITLPKVIIESLGLEKGHRFDFEQGNRKFILKY